MVQDGVWLVKEGWESEKRDGDVYKWLCRVYDGKHGDGDRLAEHVGQVCVGDGEIGRKDEDKKASEKLAVKTSSNIPGP